MTESRLGAAEINQQQQERAIALFYELIQQGLVLAKRTKVTMIQVRIPMHGTTLGQPKGSIERE